MGAKSQRKGRKGELEICRIFNACGIPAEPGQAVSYGATPDVTGIPGIHPEIKRCQQLRLTDWMKQAAEDAEKFRDGMPAVFFRRNREPWCVVMKLEDWITLYTRQKSPKSAEEGGIIHSDTT